MPPSPPGPIARPAPIAPPGPIARPAPLESPAKSTRRKNRKKKQQQQQIETQMQHDAELPAGANASPPSFHGDEVSTTEFYTSATSGSASPSSPKIACNKLTVSDEAASLAPDNFSIETSKELAHLEKLPEGFQLIYVSKSDKESEDTFSPSVSSAERLVLQQGVDSKVEENKTMHEATTHISITEETGVMQTQESEDQESAVCEASLSTNDAQRRGKNNSIINVKEEQQSWLLDESVKDEDGKTFEDVNSEWQMCSGESVIRMRDQKASWSDLSANACNTEPQLSSDNKHAHTMESSQEYNTVLSEKNRPSVFQNQLVGCSQNTGINRMEKNANGGIENKNESMSSTNDADILLKEIDMRTSNDIVLQENSESSSNEVENDNDNEVFHFQKYLKKTSFGLWKQNVSESDSKMDNWTSDTWETLTSKPANPPNSALSATYTTKLRVGVKDTVKEKGDKIKEVVKEKKGKILVPNPLDVSGKYIHASNVPSPSTIVNTSKSEKNNLLGETSLPISKQVKVINCIKPSQSNSKSENQLHLAPEMPVNIPPVSEEIVDAESVELAGPFCGCVVESFPRSAVASFRLRGISTRAYFFRNSVVGSMIPAEGSNVILEYLERVTPSQQTAQYKSTLNAKRVCLSSASPQAITGRTGAILKYTDDRTGLIEVTLPNREIILGKFTKQEVRAGSITRGISLPEAWPPGTVVHFHGEIISKDEKPECIVTHVWPQGSGAVSLAKSVPEKKKVDAKLPEVEHKKVKKESVSAHTGRVSQYISSGHGLIDFRLRDLQLSAEFRTADCSGLVFGEVLSEQWPPPTIVHFDGELIRNGRNVKFKVLKVWAGKRNIPASGPPELMVGSHHVGEVTQLRPPAAFVVTVTKPGGVVRVFVLSFYFRTSISESQLHMIVPLTGYVHIGQRILVKVKRANRDSQKDCEYIATDAWPDPPKKPDELKSKAKTQIAHASKHELKPIKLTSNSQLPTPGAKKQMGTKSLEEFSAAATLGNPTSSAAPSATRVKEVSSQQGSPNVQAQGAQGDAGALPWLPDAARAGCVRRACVLRASQNAALLRVMPHAWTTRAWVVGVHARGLVLCGISLASINLAYVLAPGQKLNVHFLKEDEERLSADLAVNQSESFVYVSVLWIGRAQFELPTMQFAELANFCKEYRVSEPLYHQLTQRLGEMLKHERQKKIGKLPDDEDDNVHELKDECAAVEQRISGVDEAELQQQLMEKGVEEFLHNRLTNLTYSVLEESLRSVQEHFLSVMQKCSDPALYDVMAMRASSIVQSAAQRFILEKQEVPSNGPKPDSWARASEAGPCRACAERASAGATAGAKASVATTANTTAIAAASRPAGSAAIVAVAGTAATVAAGAAAESPAKSAAQSPAPPTAPAGQQHQPATEPAVAPLSTRGARGTSEKGRDGQDDWTDVEKKWRARLAHGAAQGDCAGGTGLLRGIQDVPRVAQEELPEAADTSLLSHAMQEGELEKPQFKNESSELKAVEQNIKLAEEEEGQIVDGVEGKLDCQDLQKSLNAEIQKHARELAAFQDEAYRLIENWKSADSPPATPEELEFLQELSLLLDHRPERTNDKINEDAHALARQLLKFWKVANIPLTPVAQRGLQRLQEALEVPVKNTEGTEKMENNVCCGAEGIREVEAALREVRDAFRDVKHVFEVQRCFRDLRECFRDVRRAYRTREPRPRALPPCADAPAAAAAAAAFAAEAMAQAKKRGRASSDVSGSRTPSPAGTPTHSQPKKKQQQCGTCKAMVASGTGEGPLSPIDIVSSTTQTMADVSPTEVSKSSQTTATMTTDLRTVTVTTSEQAAQTISTGAVLALHLLPDE